MGENPWLVKKLDTFLWLCCPQCPFRCKKVDSFEVHALDNHPMASSFFSKPLNTVIINFTKYTKHLTNKKTKTVPIEEHNYADFELDQFRSMQNIEGKYKAQAFAVSLIKRF